MSEGAPALTPEDRAHQRWRRELGRLAPGPRVVEVVKRAGLGVFNDGFIHAGNLAYLSLLTLFPFVILAVAIASLFGHTAEAREAIAGFLRQFPRPVADLLRQPIADVLAARTGRLLWLGGIVGLWSVGSFVETIRDIVRRAYGVSARLPFWRYRLGSTLVIVGSVILALLSFLIQGALVAAEQLVARLLPWATDATGWIGLSRLAPGLVMFGALYILFYAVTPAKYRLSSCRKWPGAAFTTAWWIGATALLPRILAHLGGYNLTYGGLAGTVVMLLFFWVIGIGLVFGAHLNAALAEPPGAGVEPAPTVVRRAA